MKKAIIFDVDGTLWDAVPVITDAWNESLKQFPDITKQLKLSDVEPMMGRTMDEYAGLFTQVGEERAKEIVEICCREEIDYIKSHPGVLYPGIRSVIEQLHEEFSLYIVSNCQEGYIEALLESCELQPYFEDFENYGRTGKQKGRNIQILMERCDIDKAIYIGDTIKDLEASREAGIPFIYAAYGMGEVEHQRFTVNCPAEIPEVIKKTKYFAL
ncbi:MAG: HAD family hydrolase [Lachnospiraceae bacterium]|nr:HAD family hydrolase [Lachnospiraceae bacterium]